MEMATIFKAKQENFVKGRNGELIAKNYLTREGYIFVTSNYSNKIGEIDLIMYKDDILVFFEVKLKTSEEYGYPEEMINKAKIRQIRRVADGYLCMNTRIAKEFEKYRLDAVCIVMNNKTTINRITHYENLY